MSKKEKPKKHPIRGTKGKMRSERKTVKALEKRVDDLYTAVSLLNNGDGRLDTRERVNRLLAGDLHHEPMTTQMVAPDGIESGEGFANS